MSVRTFTSPSSLDAKISSGRIRMTPSNGDERSMNAAKDSAQAYSAEKREPLASHINPKSKPGITYAAQDKLPKLPIPELEQTCQRYLENLSPLQSYKEHRDTDRAVQEFLRSEGPDLQAKLKKYAEGKANYIEQFCK